MEIINEVTYFNKRIKQFALTLTWYRRIFMYYDRYYRYRQNERLFFDKKNFLNYKHGHKLHFVSYIKNRELTGIRLNKNHMVF